MVRKFGFASGLYFFVSSYVSSCLLVGLFLCSQGVFAAPIPKAEKEAVVEFFEGEDVIVDGNYRGKIVFVLSFENTIDIRFEDGIIQSIAISRVSELPLRLAGFEVGEKIVTLNHRSGTIQTLYPTGQVLIRFQWSATVELWNINQISHIPQSIDGFKVGDRVALSDSEGNDSKGVIDAVYLDGTADIRLRDYSKLLNVETSQIRALSN